jgi:hypothetical protein
MSGSKEKHTNHSETKKSRDSWKWAVGGIIMAFFGQHVLSAAAFAVSGYRYAIGR